MPEQSELRLKGPVGEHGKDIFLCHTGAEKPWVEKLAEKIEAEPYLGVFWEPCSTNGISRKAATLLPISNGRLMLSVCRRCRKPRSTGRGMADFGAKHRRLVRPIRGERQGDSGTPRERAIAGVAAH